MSTAPLSTALVRLAPATDSAPVLQVGSRPRADFLAQLIATSVKAPQTRVRRRAEPDVAIALLFERSNPDVCGRGAAALALKDLAGLTAHF